MLYGTLPSSVAQAPQSRGCHRCSTVLITVPVVVLCPPACYWQWGQKHFPRDVTCTCWKRIDPTYTDNNVNRLAYQRETRPKRIETEPDTRTGTHVYLDTHFRYVDTEGVPVVLAGPDDGL